MLHEIVLPDSHQPSVPILPSMEFSEFRVKYCISFYFILDDKIAKQHQIAMMIHRTLAASKSRSSTPRVSPERELPDSPRSSSRSSTMRQSAPKLNTSREPAGKVGVKRESDEAITSGRDNVGHAHDHASSSTSSESSRGANSSSSGGARAAGGASAARRRSTASSRRPARQRRNSASVATVLESKLDETSSTSLPGQGSRNSGHSGTSDLASDSKNEEKRDSSHVSQRALSQSGRTHVPGVNLRRSQRTHKRALSESEIANETDLNVRTTPDSRSIEQSSKRRRTIGNDDGKSQSVSGMKENDQTTGDAKASDQPLKRRKTTKNESTVVPESDASCEKPRKRRRPRKSLSPPRLDRLSSLTERQQIQFLLKQTKEEAAEATDSSLPTKKARGRRPSEEGESRGRQQRSDESSSGAKRSPPPLVARRAAPRRPSLSRRHSHGDRGGAVHVQGKSRGVDAKKPNREPRAKVPGERKSTRILSTGATSQSQGETTTASATTALAPSRSNKRKNANPLSPKGRRKSVRVGKPTNFFSPDSENSDTRNEPHETKKDESKAASNTDKSEPKLDKNAPKPSHKRKRPRSLSPVSRRRSTRVPKAASFFSPGVGSGLADEEDDEQDDGGQQQPDGGHESTHASAKNESKSSSQRENEDIRGAEISSKSNGVPTPASSASGESGNVNTEKANGKGVTVQKPTSSSGGEHSNSKAFEKRTRKRRATPSAPPPIVRRTSTRVSKSTDFYSPDPQVDDEDDNVKRGAGETSSNAGETLSNAGETLPDAADFGEVKSKSRLLKKSFGSTNESGSITQHGNSESTIDSKNEDARAGCEISTKTVESKSYVVTVLLLDIQRDLINLFVWNDIFVSCAVQPCLLLFTFIGTKEKQNSNITEPVGSVSWNASERNGENYQELF